MNIIETTAPIGIEQLKEYFSNKETQYVIDYEGSELQDEKLLVYLSNLELPCDLVVNDFDNLKQLLKTYMNTSFMVNIPLLEKSVIALLLQKKELVEKTDQNLLDELSDELEVWSKRFDSLTLYNMFTINNTEIQDWVKSQPVAEDDGDTRGINFVNLLKHDISYDLIQKVKDVKYYPIFFNDYIFKGNNLFTYWAVDNNPMFLLTYGIAKGIVDPKEYIEAKRQTIQEMAA